MRAAKRGPFWSTRILAAGGTRPSKNVVQTCRIAALASGADRGARGVPELAAADATAQTQAPAATTLLLTTSKEPNATRAALASGPRASSPVGAPDQQRTWK